MIDFYDTYTSPEATDNLVDALPKLIREITDVTKEQGSFSVGTLMMILPDGLMTQKVSAQGNNWKVRYPKLGCSMTIVGEKLPDTLADMVLLMARNNYLREWK